MRRVLLATGLLLATPAHSWAQGALTPPANSPGGKPPICTNGSTPCRATRVFDFLDSIGMNMHLGSQFDTPYGDVANGGQTGPGSTSINGYQTNVSKIANAMNYIGVHHFRDVASDPTGANNQRVDALASFIPSLSGVYLMDKGGSNAFTTSDLQNFANNLGNIVPISRIDAVEPSNEFQGFGKTYNGASGAGALCQSITDYTPLINSRLTALGVQLPRLAPSVGGDNDFLGKQACRSLSTTGNGHSYSWTGAPMANLAGFNGISPGEWVKDTSDAAVGANASWATEIGISSAGAGTAYAVDDSSEAKQNLNQLLDQRVIGYTRNYLYELVDENNRTGLEAHFGQFYFDWTAKPAANALHNQAVILSDPACPYSSTSQSSCLSTAAATFSPGAITYSLSNAPANTYSMLMQRSDGTYILAVWGDIFPYNQGNSTDIVTTPTTVTVNLPAMSTIALTDPLNGTTPTTLPAGSSAQIQISDHPVYLTMVVSASGGTGAGGGTPPPVSPAGPAFRQSCSAAQ